MVETTVNDPVEQFLDALKTSLAKGTFVKLTLGNYKGADEHLQKILVRLIDTKKGTRLFVQSRYAQRDIVQNYPVDEGVAVVRGHLENGFRNGHLFTTEHDFQLDIGKRSSRLNVGRPTFTKFGSEKHDREKHYLVDQSAYYLKALGVTTEDGKIRADQRDKWKQINKFVEVLDGLFRRSRLKERDKIRIIDMGSGKGYLTFAAYDHFVSILGGRDASVGERVENSGYQGTLLNSHVSARSVSMTGLDARTDLVELCSQIAEAGGYEGLRFQSGTIADFAVDSIDVLIALHACDTATDEALFKGISASAEIIVAAPCCHREIRKELKPPEFLGGILKHPVLLERTAETITDGLRSLLLEGAGYSTKMFEFVPTEHTPKNNMLVAVKGTAKPDKTRIVAEIEALKDTFGIKSQRLADLLKSTGNSAQTAGGE